MSSEFRVESRIEVKFPMIHLTVDKGKLIRQLVVQYGCIANNIETLPVLSPMLQVAAMCYTKFNLCLHVHSTTCCAPRRFEKRRNFFVINYFHFVALR